MYERTYHNQVLHKNEPFPSKQQTKVSWKKVVGVLGSVVLIVGAFFLIRASVFQVKDIRVTGVAVLDSHDIELVVKKEIEGTVFWLFPKKSIFLISRSSLEKKLKETFSRIETVSVSRADNDSLLVTIKEYQGVYLWCAPDSQECYFMDTQGVVYIKAPVFSGAAYPKITTGSPLETLPFKAMSTEEVARIAELEKGLSAIGITPALFKTISSRELAIYFLHNKVTAVLRVDPTIPVSTSLEYLFSGLRAEPLASMFEDKNAVLLYIDVRFSNKIVYKFQE